MAPALEKSESEQKPQIKIVRNDYARGIPIPWRLKMFAKIFLSGMPFSYNFLSRIGIFRHGDTSRELKTLYGSFDDHLSFYKERAGRVPEACLELGCGDSVGHALCAKAAGVNSMWLLDVDDFATEDENHYRQVCNDLNLSPPSCDRPSILEFSNAHYKTAGVKSFQDIPDESLDFSFSHAVLEHIHRDEFQTCMNELYRTHKKGGLSRHWVDLHDHLGGALNSFRFSPGFWESPAVQNAGFYTNRLTMQDMLDMAGKAGFRVRVERIHRWVGLPTPKNAIHQYFKDKSEDELNVCTFLIVMEKS